MHKCLQKSHQIGTPKSVIIQCYVKRNVQTLKKMALFNIIILIYFNYLIKMC